MRPTAEDRDTPFDRLLARGLAREATASSRACPDADLLAAWFDRSLSTPEAARIEAHAAGCLDCQRLLADLARSEPDMVRAAPLPAPARPLIWHWRWLLPVATASILIAVGVRSLSTPDQASPASPPAGVLEADARPQTVVAREEKAASLAAAPPAAEPVRASRPEPGDGAAPAANRERIPPPAEKRAENTSPAAPPAAQLADAMAAPARVSEAALPTPAAAPGAPGQATRAAPAPSAFQATAQAPKMAAESTVAAGGAPAAALRTVPVAARNDAARGPGPRVVLAPVRTPADAATIWRFSMQTPGERGVLERSDDTGTTWTWQRTVDEGPLLAGSAASSTICWFVGAGGVIIRTTDGRTWDRVNSPTTLDLVSVLARGAAEATVVTLQRTEYVTTDGGRTWLRK